MKKNIFIIILLVFGLNNTIVSQNKDVTIRIEKNDDKTIDFYYEKEIPGSIYLNLDLTSLQNSNSRGFSGIINDNKGSLFTLRPINDKQGIGFGYKYSYVRGVPNPKVDSLFIYSLPFKKGNIVTIAESGNLKEKYFGTEKPSKWKSYTIDRTFADTVCSMRKGIVTKIINEFTRDTQNDYAYTSKMNSITIQHSDGTVASYKGFKQNSLFVKLGQTVYPETKLGVLDLYDENLYRLYFNIYYLIDNNINSKGKKTSKNKKSYTEYLTPFFITKKGSLKLENRTEYTTDFNESILFIEFTKREKKNYKKNPELFN